MSKLHSVIRHEYLTIVKQPSFWIVMIAIPLAIAFIWALTYFSNTATSNRIDELAKDLKNVSIIDESSLINKQVVESVGLHISPAADTASLREAVRTGTREALIVFPANLTTNRHYQLYLASNDLTKMGSVTALADNILKTSLFLPLGSAEVIALAQQGASADMTIFKNGEVSAGFNEYIAPGIFIILFYIIFAFSVGYMLNSVSEEKENRSMEMVLTYVKPGTLIVGKLLAVSLVTLTQLAFFGLMAAIAYIILLNSGSGVSLPFGLDIAKIVFDPMTIFFATAYLIAGFLMFAGFMIATAAAAPSTKEANSFSAVFYIGAFIPFYFISVIATDPHNPVVNFLTYFPLTSPVVTLIRNTLGTLSPVESWIALGVMAFFTYVSINIAVRAFKLGALEFSQTIKLSKLFKN